MDLTSTDTDSELLVEIGALEVERARLEARIAEHMLAYADVARDQAARHHDDPVVRDLEAGAAADSLGQVLRQPTRTVQVRLSQARRVRSMLPQVWLAHRSGRIDAFRVQLVAEATYRLQNDDSVLSLDREVVDVAATRTTAQLKAWLRRFVARTEPDRSADRERSEAEKRRVYVEHGPDGWSWLNALVPSTAAHRIDRLLSRLAEKRADGVPHLTLEQARSDVLADLALGRITFDDEPTGRSHGGAVIAVTVPVTSLAGLTDEPGTTFDGEIAPPAEPVRELAAEPGTLFHRLLTDPAGRVLDVTELGRFPTERLRLGVQARDGTCAFSTCSRPADLCDLDHEIAHPRGPTSGSNLRPLCRRHHRLKSHGLLPRPTPPSRLEHRLARVAVDWVAA
jgi:hypothetical protein